MSKPLQFPFQALLQEGAQGASAPPSQKNRAEGSRYSNKAVTLIKQSRDYEAVHEIKISLYLLLYWIYPCAVRCYPGLGDCFIRISENTCTHTSAAVIATHNHFIFFEVLCNHRNPYNSKLYSRCSW